MGLCLAIVYAVAEGPPSLLAAAASDRGAAAALQRFLDGTPTAHQYSASRRLEASGPGRHGWLDVHTEFRAGSGLSYAVTAEGGSGVIRSRVLRSLLEEEQKLIASGRGAAIALSTANYEFTPEGVDEEGVALVGLRPRRADRSLIAGRMFLTGDGALIRIEGRLAKSPSFWLTRVNVVRSYRPINGVVMPVSLETTARVRLFGSSSLRMTYRYVQIDDRAVVDDSLEE